MEVIENKEKNSITYYKTLDLKMVYLFIHIQKLVEHTK